MILNLIDQINNFVYKGYYIDEETGFYYLKERYYAANLGRFINADNYNYVNNQSVTGVNLFSYCSNNPVKRIDLNGTSWWSSLWNRVDGFFTKVGKVIDDTIGFSASFGQELGVEVYNFWWSTEVGSGYSKSFDNNKPINFNFSAPNKWWKLWEYSVGVDININGYGGGFYRGNESGISIHNPKASYDYSSNIRGQTSFQISRYNENNGYTYSKFSINKYEIGLTILAAYLAVSAAPILAPAGAAAAFAVTGTIRR